MFGRFVPSRLPSRAGCRRMAACCLYARPRVALRAEIGHR